MNPRHLALVLLASAVPPAVTALPITQFNTVVTENFDTLALATSSALPVGWSFSEAGTSANSTYGAGTGASTTGNTYSFGLIASSDRAFGTLRTASLASTIGTIVVNNTGGTITQLAVNYTGEQWRLGAAGRVDRLDFSYSLNATSLTTGLWIDVDALDFIAPTTSGTTGAVNGNAPANQVPLSFAITGLGIPPGAGLWLKWTDFDALGSDDGLAIDNFAVTAVQPVIAPPPPPSPVPDDLPFGVYAAVIAGVLMLSTRSHRVAYAQSRR